MKATRASSSRLVLSWCIVPASRNVSFLEILCSVSTTSKWAGFQNCWRRMISEIYAWGGFQLSTRSRSVRGSRDGITGGYGSRETGES